MSVAQLNPGFPGFLHLVVEPCQVGPALMINKAVLQQCSFKTSLFYPDTKVNIFSKPHRGESPGLSEHFPGEAHIETSGLEFFHR